MRKVRNLKSLSKIVPDYEDQLKAFDKINQKLIGDTKKNIEGLRKFLKPEEKKLIEELKTVPEAYYWRQSKNISCKSR